MHVPFAAVFPGQGSQSIGMMAAWGEHQALVEQTFAQASLALGGVDLWSIACSGPEAEINRTEITQPIMLTAGVAAWRVWQVAGGAMPVCMAGHSLGEYTALVCAEAMDFEDAVRVVAERGRLMQQAVPMGEGAMAAVLGLEDAVVLAVCAEATQGAEGQGNEIVEAVNFNSPGQVVIAGSAAAVARATPLLQAKGAKRVLPLPVSVPSHSSLMQNAALQMGKVLDAVEIRRPQIPVLHNVDALEHAEPAALRAALVSQLHRPVLWVDSVRAMQSRGVGALVEFGPGKVLAGLTKRIERDLAAYPVLDLVSLGMALNDLSDLNGE
ncbi:MAG: [acyl-carrier-protein] S-malonyltransferase [Gammaproteobacteria bacterium 28-57-27]|nr:MAG: [acyl-carrier-protein] S-malonyltransferase [Gammaproteobacteria bacterium 28-57-27]